MVNWETEGYIAASKHRQAVLALLKEKAMTPSQVASKLKLSLAHASKVIKELEAKGIVECKNPKARKGRLYAITQPNK